MKHNLLFILLLVTLYAFTQTANEANLAQKQNQLPSAHSGLLTSVLLPSFSVLATDTFLTQKTKAIKREQERREHDARRHESRDHDPRMREPRRNDERRINREAYVLSGKYSRKSAIELLVLGSVKIALGAACFSAIATQDDGLFSIGFPILGGFHILTGAAMLAPGVILLKKSKRQAAAYGNRAYLSMPSLYTPRLGGSGFGIGLQTTLTF